MQSQISYFINCALLLIFVFVSCHSNPKRDEMSEARSYLWTDVLKSDSILSSLDTTGWSNDERLYWEVTNASITLRIEHELPEEFPYDSLINVCVRKKYNDLAGELYYLRGTTHLNKVDSATIWMKKAEEHLVKADDEEQLAMVYIRLADLCEDEYLFHLAYEYNKKANRCVGSNNTSIKLASFRGMYRRYKYSNNPNDSTFVALKDSALYYAKQMESPEWKYEIYLGQALIEDNSEQVFATAKYLCDSADLCRYASLVAQHYINNHKYKEAEHYLQIFASSFDERGFDFSDWDTRKYHYLRSRYLYETGHPQEAFEMMRALNDSIDEVIDRTARVRTYAISRAYDVEKEKATNLQLTNQRQHLRIVIITVVSLLIIALLIFFLFINRQRMRHEHEEERLRMTHEAEKAELQHQIDIKNASLETKREMLTRELKKRLALVREAQIVKMKKTETITDGLVRILFDDKQIDIIVQDFNDATEAYLEDLAANHPQLTKADCRLIVFDLLGMSNEDICIILQQETPSIWTRRRRTKEHLGIEGNSYYEWLQQDLQRHLNH